MDEVGEHQRHDHQQVRDALVNRRPCSQTDQEELVCIRLEKSRPDPDAWGKLYVNRRQKDSPSLVGAGAGACAAAPAGKATAKTSAAAKARPSGVLAMAAAGGAQRRRGAIPLSLLSLLVRMCVHSLPAPL